MAVFMVVITDPTRLPAIRDRLGTIFATRNLPVSSDSWLVSGSGTAQRLSDSLGISDGSVGFGVVVSIGSYFGRANPQIWEWIKANWESVESV